MDSHANEAAVGPQQRRCECTLPFSLHLTVMIFGIVGFILGLVSVAILRVLLVGQIWLLITAALVFASGLQGVLMVPGSPRFNCHIILAVINLVNLGVFGFACLFVASAFWIIWVVAVFVFELWVTISRYCCKNNAAGAPGVAGTELPVAQPGVVHVVHCDPATQPTYPAYKQPYGQY